jgi:hypothetical protein
MARVDPFVPLSDWQTSLYRGTPAAIDQFLDRIDETLLPGWVRDRDYERTRLRPDSIRSYLFDREGDVAVRVWLQRVTPTRVRGGPIELLRRPTSGDAEWIGRLVGEFADDCVLPAAAAAGVRYTHPSFGPRGAVTFAAEMMFTRLADTADGEWPLTDRFQEAWEELISFCLAEQVAFHPPALVRWLVDSGWEPADAAALADRLFADSAWLAKRLDAMAR